MVLDPIVSALLERAPDLKIVVSAFTDTGYQRACELFSGRCSVTVYPLDFPQAVKRALSAIQPRLYACVETELWPNMLFELDRRGIERVLLNARISSRSFPRYRRIRPLMKRMLSGFEGICAISDQNRIRLEALGARPETIVVTGNAKYQGLISKTSRPEERQEARAEVLNGLGLAPGSLVWVCGSIRGKEHEYIIDTFCTIKDAFSSLHLVLAPRHLERLGEIEGCLQGRGLEYRLWSRRGKGAAETGGRVTIVDQMGQLFQIYSAASFAFVGGSLIPLGGQNPMEPAAWQCPVLYGPYMDNFEDAIASLEARKAGIRVSGPDRLSRVVAYLIENERFRMEAGARARLALEDLAGGAADRQAEMLLERLTVS